MQFHPDDCESCAPKFALLRNPNEKGRWLMARDLLNWGNQAKSFYKKKYKIEFCSNSQDLTLLYDLGDHQTLDDRLTTAQVPRLQRKQQMLLERKNK